MATGYQRQSVASIVNGNVINASDFNNEFNALLSAFDKTSGHTHDGTTVGGGAPIVSLTGTVLTGCTVSAAPAYTDSSLYIASTSFVRNQFATNRVLGATLNQVLGSGGTVTKSGTGLTTTSGGGTIINFDSPFPVSCVSVQLTLSGSTSPITMSVITKGQSGFVALAVNTSGTALATFFYWTATGF